MHSGTELFRRIERFVPFLFIGLAVLPMWVASGCGEDQEQVITINLQPWTLGFDSTNQFYLVERYYYASLLKFTTSGSIYDLSGVIQPPGTGGFFPWGLHVATRGAGVPDVVFVSDVSTSNPTNRLLALNPDISGEVGLDNLLLGQTNGPAGSPFHELRDLTSLFVVGNNQYRVFVIDHDLNGEEKIQVADYDITDRTFTFRDPITWAGGGNCPDALVDPYGVAVDPDHNALYVADQHNDALYRFSGIQTGGTVNCDKERRYWKNTEDSLNQPSGVAYLTGAVTPPQENYIVVADSENLRLVAFTWNGLDFVAENLPDNFEPFTGAAPFGVTFDQDGNLWASYPNASAIAGPQPAGTL